MSNSVEPLEIGRIDWWAPGNFNGSIADVRIYNYALSQSEITNSTTITNPKS